MFREAANTPDDKIVEVSRSAYRADRVTRELAKAAILAGAARLVKPGGRLVYATCSVLEQENEAIVTEFTTAHGKDFKQLPVAELLEKAHVAGAEGLVRGDCLRLWPHRHGTDGFFAAAWERC